MNWIIIVSLIAYSSAAQLNNAYLPPSHAHTSGGSHLIEAPIVVANEAVSHGPSAELNSHGDHQSVNGYQSAANVEGHHAVQANREQHYHAIPQSPERAQAALERNAAILRQQFENNVDSYAYVYETANGLYGEESGVATHGVQAHGAYSYTGDDGKLYRITYTADENGFRPQGDHLPTPPPIPEEILKALEANARDEAAGIFDDGSYNEGKYGDKTVHSHVTNNDDTIVTNPAVLSNAQLVESHNLNTVAHIPQVILRNPNKAYTPLTNFQYEQGVNGQRYTQSGRAYLPPSTKILDGRSQNGQLVFGARTRQPSFNPKSGYKY